MDKVTNDYRLSNWAALVKECCESGMRKTDWCSQHGIPPKTYYYWQRKVRNSYTESLPASLPTAPQRETSFAQIVLSPENKPVKHCPPALSPDVIIRTGTLTIEVSNNASKELIAMIRSVVKYAAGK